MRGGFPVALRRVTTYGLSVALSTAMLALALSAWADEPAEQPLFTIVPADADAAVLDAKQKMWGDQNGFQRQFHRLGIGVFPLGGSIVQ